MGPPAESDDAGAAEADETADGAPPGAKWTKSSGGARMDITFEPRMRALDALKKSLFEAKDRASPAVDRASATQDGAPEKMLKELDDVRKKFERFDQLGKQLMNPAFLQP